MEKICFRFWALIEGVCQNLLIFETFSYFPCNKTVASFYKGRHIQGVSQKSVINLTVVRGCLGKYFGIGNIGSQQLIKG